MKAKKSMSAKIKQEKPEIIQKDNPKIKKASGPVFTHPRRNLWAMGGQVFWVSIIAALVTAIIIGGGIYFYQEFFYGNQIQELTNQIKTLNEQIELGSTLAQVRGEVKEEGPSCPVLQISDNKKYILADGVVLDFTNIEQKDEEEGFEIINVAKNEDCTEIAIGMVSSGEGGGSSIIRHASLDGTRVQSFVVYESSNDITIKELKDNFILYTYQAHGAGLDAGTLQSALNTAFLNTQTGVVEEWGKVYAYSSDWNYTVIDRSGDSILIDMVNDQELAVLSHTGEDYATDFVFSSEGGTIAYLYFAEREDTAFLGNYFNFCSAESIEGKISVWDIDTGLQTDIMSGDIKGIRLTSFKDNMIHYTKWETDTVEKTLALP